jgi:hypothetical protein
MSARKHPMVSDRHAGTSPNCCQPIRLAAEPRSRNLIFASGQTGSINDGHITEDPVPNYNQQSPTRYAYLMVIDPKTEDNLWSDRHLWGGLLTGFNSVGERLIKELENQSKK